MAMSKFQPKYGPAIAALDDCVRACNFCSAASLREKDIMMLAKCIELDDECAAVCSLTSQLLSRNSEFVKDLARFCANVCDACATECEKHSHMEHCRECAEACRKCSMECRKISA